MLVLHDDVIRLFLLVFWNSRFLFLDSSLNVVFFNLADEAQAIAVAILNLKSVEEGTTVLVLRNEVNTATKFLDDELRDHQPQPNSLEVELLLLILDRSKHFEQLLFVLFPNANACISD